MTREQWLDNAVEHLRTGLFHAADLVVPPVRITAGWGRSGALADGECDFGAVDRVPQVFISPKYDEPVETLVIVTHELVHAHLGVDGHAANDHGKAFKTAARAVGLRAPFIQAWAHPVLLLHLARVADDLGPYPHARLV